MRFDGDKKVGKSLLWGPEEHLKAWLLPKVPKRVETYHLTATTVLWSALIIVFSFLAASSRHWLWLASLMIFFQYITDLLDGAIGRQRDTGLIKWGFYMDHFLDYIFLCSILIGYSFLVEDHYKYMLFFVISLFGAFMVNSFLSFAATNEFKISYLGIGPTEIRIVFIFINCLLIFQRQVFVLALPYVLAFSTFGLFVTVYQTQKAIWAIDMRNKHGDGVAEPGPGALSDHEWSLGISKRKMARNIVLSLSLAFVAFALLMLRVMAPHHRKLAFGLYLVSWIPFLLSFRHKRDLLQQRGQQIKGLLKPWLPHIAVAVGLLLVGYTANTLAPMGADLPEELEENLKEDRTNIRIVCENMVSLLDWIDTEGILSRPVASLSPDDKDKVRQVWRQFVTASIELDLLRSKYQGFHKIDRLSSPELHADAFFIAYAAHVTQLKAFVRLLKLVGDNPFMETLLNDADPARAIPKDSFYRVRRFLADPGEMLRLGAGGLYLKLVGSDVTFSPPYVNAMRADVRAIYVALGKDPSTWIKNPLDIFEKAAFSAWFPMQKEVALHMSLIRTTNRKDNFITEALLNEHRQSLEPGDILLERRNWYMSNVGIPGFWPHVALYIGTVAQLDDYFADLPVLGGEKPTAVIRKAHPDAFRKFESLDASDHERCIMEALRPGCIFTSLEVSGTADYLAALRPRMSKAERFKVILAAFSHHKKPYDYNFDFASDSALVCSELVHKAYQAADGLTLPPTLLNGRLIVSPNYFAEKFADELGTEKQQLDFVLFLDGNERHGSAALSDAESFAETWKRPKWDVMQE